jgi:selenocysteine-specific elongation factor
VSVRHCIVATAGHVDHGKSALVKALTGTDPDRLPEEKARGITIDLGFAHLILPNPDGSQFSVGIVDVPGHEDFVKNMVAGVGSIDLALFVIAADDGWMPQTEEHLQILTYLGVRNAVVALTKSDLAGDGTPGITDAIRRRLAGSPFASSRIVPVSALTGVGIEALKTALAAALAEMPPAPDPAKPRLAVDRVFTLRGIGVIATGTLTGGILQRGQAVVIQPGGRTTRIRSMQSHGQEAAQCEPGTRVAVNLHDVEGGGADGLRRGDVITIPGLGTPCDTLDVLLEKSPRSLTGAAPAQRPLKDGALVRVHHGSGHFVARIALIDTKELEPGAAALAQIRSSTPVHVFAGDRFVIRDWPEQWTLAGGLVLDPDAERRFLKSESRKEFLRSRAEAPADARVFALSELKCRHAVRRDAMLLKSRFSREQIDAALRELIRDGGAVDLGEWVACGAWWKTVRGEAETAVDREHQAHPQSQGLAVSALRDIVRNSLPAPEIFEALARSLTGGDFLQVGTVIRRKGHRPALPPNLAGAGARLRSVLAAKPFDPPSRKELAPDSASQQALRFLIQTGEAAALGDDVVVLTENLERMTAIVQTFLQSGRKATAGELRQAVGGSRRIVIPLLERLDREGVTRREGDLRVLGKH